MPLQKVDYATEFLGLETNARTYEKIRRGVLPPGVVVWVGKHVRIDPEKLAEWAANGGRSTLSQQLQPVEAKAAAA